MNLRATPPLHLTYCLNVHPGETWAENRASICEKAAAVRERVGRPGPFGLGLRLSRCAADELVAEPALDDLRALLAREDFYAFTINGFPYGAFHGAPVKQNVYRPDWRATERLDYTLRLATILARILPSGIPGSISTVPGSYKTWITTPDDVQAMVRNLVDAALGLAVIEERTGAAIALALEPEPDCFLETTAETVAFFEEQLFRRGVEYARARSGRSASACEALLRGRLGVCFDTCHLALQFEDLAQSLARLRGRGIAVPKIQLSAALRLVPREGVVHGVDRFVDSVYLHQIKARDATGRITAYPDLDLATVAEVLGRGAREVRAHFHVPLYYEGSGGLLSTASLLDDSFFGAALAAGVPHWEIETYTFHVLPPDMQALGVEESIACEYRWVLKRLGHALAAPLR